MLVSGVNCSPEFAAYEMKMNNDKFHIEETDDNRTCYHGYQSFDPKEKDLTPEEVHQMGVELVKRLYPNFQVVVTTHKDRGHLHNHFVINAVNMEGRKLEDRLANPKEGLYGLRDVSDQIALEHGLKIIEDAPKIGRFHKNKYIYNLATQSWKSQIIVMLESLKDKCYSFEDLLENLSIEGYQIKPGKNIRIKPLGKQKFVTMKVLGEEYSEESLRSFFYNKRSNYNSFVFNSYKIMNEDSDILKIQDLLAQSSKESIILSMKGISSGSYPKYYNARYREYKRYNKIVDTINFLNDNKIFSYEDLLNKIEEFKTKIEAKEKEYNEQQSLNETLQLRVPLCELYLQYLDYYESYKEQVEIVKDEVDPGEEVKVFLEIQEELQVSSVDEVKDIIVSANRIKTECNRSCAYLSYLKHQASELEKLKGMSIENEKGYIKSISFSKKMIDETRSNESTYCIRVPYSSDLYFYIPKDNVAWVSYDNRAIAYLIDDKEYDLYNKENQVIRRIRGEELAEVEKEEKQKISEYYKEKKER